MEALLPSCNQAKAVSLPTVNHEEGGRSALQRVERAAALHRALHISMDVETTRPAQLHMQYTGTISRTNCGRNVFLFLAK